MSTNAPLSPEEEAHVRETLSQLKLRTLEIFLLFTVDRFTIRQIASQQRLPTFWVRRHILKAIAHIDCRANARLHDV